jgi:hypothetical protein
MLENKNYIYRVGWGGAEPPLISKSVYKKKEKEGGRGGEALP